MMELTYHEQLERKQEAVRQLFRAAVDGNITPGQFDDGVLQLTEGQTLGMIHDLQVFVRNLTLESLSEFGAPQ